MEESILTSIKKLLGIAESNTDFDTDIVMHINSVFMILRQLGVGPETGFNITGNSETWFNYLGEEKNKLALVRSYIYLKVRLLFDPPVGSVLESINRSISEFEWRLNVEVDPKTT